MFLRMKNIMNYELKFDFPISRLGLGTWQAAGGESWSGHSDEELLAAYHYALDGGVNFIDTAPVYGSGHSEELVGRLIADYHRDKLFIATKCGLPQHGRRIKSDLSFDSILTECDESLKRLRTDYIDLYQIHWPPLGKNAIYNIEETISAMKHLQNVGKVRFVGICNHSLADTKIWHKSGILSSYQGLYNLIDRNPTEFHDTPLPYRTENEILPFVRETGIAFFPYCPLAQGLLSGKYSSQGNAARLSRYDVRWSNSHYKNVKAGIIPTEIQNKSAEELLAMAFSFLTDKPEITSVITGMSSVEQVKMNLKGF